MPELTDADMVGKFNADPHANLVSFCMHFKQSTVPDRVAVLLHSVEGLDRQVVTDFLLSPGREEICKAYFDQSDLVCDFLTAMRRCFCAKIIFPESAKKVGLAVRLFVERYVVANSGMFPNEDDAITQAFVLLMVNGRPTTLPAGVTDRAAPNQAQLDQLAKEPLVFSERSPTWILRALPSMRGWLARQSGHIWKGVNMFVVVAGGSMYWFTDNTPANKDRPAGQAELVGVEVVREGKGGFKFSLAQAEGIRIVSFAKGLELVKGVKKAEFKAASPAVREQWVAALRRAVVFAQFLGGEKVPPTFEDE
jgi:hypothetical protein